MSEGLYSLLIHEGQERRSKAFLDEPGERAVCYGAFLDLAERLGCAIAARIAEGDRVAVQVEKSPEALALYLATLAAGGVFMPLNPAYTPEEIEMLVDDARPALRIADPTASLARAGAGIPLLHLDARGGGTLIDAPGVAAALRDRPLEAPAALLYTSGTTGRPKGVVLTGANLLANAVMLRDAWRIAADDVLLHMLPLFHVHGLFVALHPVLLTGGSVSFHRRFDVSRVIDDIPRCTVVMGVPTMYGRLLDDDRLDRATCAESRLFTSGSAPLTPDIHRRFAERTGHAIVERYGMTEAGIITSNPLEGDRVPGTVGYPLAGVRIRVVDDRGAVAPPGTPGSVEVTGPNVFGGYWRRLEATEAVFTPDGWLRTGDVGHLAQDGRLTLEGRATDLIISGGLNIAPRQVEVALARVPSIEEVAVVGIPHPDLGEAVVAFVVTDRIDFDEIERALAGVARFKHPKRYEAVSSLPRNAMGKVEKVRLRAGYADLFIGR